MMNPATSLSSPTQPRNRRNEGLISTSTSNQSFQSTSSRLLQIDPISAPTPPPIALGDISAEMASDLIDTRPNSSTSNHSSHNSDESTQLPHQPVGGNAIKSLSKSRGIDSHHPTLSNLNLNRIPTSSQIERLNHSSNSPPSSSGIHDVFHTPTTNLTPSTSQQTLLTTPRIGTHAHAIPPPRSESTMTDPSDLDDLSSTDDYYDDPNLPPNSSNTRFGQTGFHSIDREINSLTYENLSSGSFGNGILSKSTTPKLGGFGVKDNHKVQQQQQQQQQSSSPNGKDLGQINGRISSASTSTNSSLGGGLSNLDQNLRTPPKSRRTASASTPPVTPNPNEWASNFWCVITDPMSGQSFFANPETGSCCWEVPAGTFVLPPNPDGQWWELLDEARGLPYFYHTSTKVSTWIRPVGFVIPLTAIQESTLGRRFSKTEFGKDHLSALASSHVDEESRTDPKVASAIPSSTSKRLSQPPAPAHSPSIEQVLAFENDKEIGNVRGLRHQTMGSRDDLMAHAMAGGAGAGARTRALGSRLSSAANGSQASSSMNKTKIPVVQLEPPSSSPSKNLSKGPSLPSKEEKKRPTANRTQSAGNERRGHGGSSDPSGDQTSSERSLDLSTLSSFEISAPIRRERDPAKRNGPMSLLRTRKVSFTGSNKNQKNSKSKSSDEPSSEPGVTRLSTGEHRVLPSSLADEIRKVNFSGFAEANFSPHRAGILRRKTPTHKLSSFQKTPITAPLLPLDKELQKDAVKIFKVILRICGDREIPVHSKLPPLALTSYGTVPDRNITSSPAPGSPQPTPSRKNSSGLGTPVGAGIQSFGTPTKNHHQKENSDDSFNNSQSPPSVLEEERWLLERGILGGPKLRDEIYVQVLKQLSENPRMDSTFRCWQLLCVLLDTFPPTLTFHSYLRDFIEGHANLADLASNGKASTGSGEFADTDAVTAMARHCVGSLARVQRRGARGRAPSLMEIECSSEKAFNPTVFGLRLEEVMEVQQKAYPDAKVPIICTFLTEALLAVGAEREGIFRVAGDSDIITELKVRIERGQYTLADLQGFDADSDDAETDVAVLTSLLKLWLRELDSPLIPDDMYQDCLSASKTPSRAIALVRELPTINKRVLLFVISFLQLFCPPSVVKQTKMPPESIALVWSPNILRNESLELNIAFPNSRLEQSFVKQLLLYLDCQSIDEDYQPPHHVEKQALLDAIRDDNEKNSNSNKSSSSSSVRTNGKSSSGSLSSTNALEAKPLPHLYGRALSPITDDTESVTTDSTAPGRA